MLALAFEHSPALVAMVDETDKLVLANPAFEEAMGPAFKFANLRFFEAAADDKSKDALRQALRDAREGGGQAVRARDANMLTMAAFPVARHFDWSLRAAPGGLVCVVGEPVTEQDEKQREKDAECAHTAACRTIPPLPPQPHALRPLPPLPVGCSISSRTRRSRCTGSRAPATSSGPTTRSCACSATRRRSTSASPS